MGSVPGSRRSLREGVVNLLQYSCLGNPMDKGAQWATVHGVTKSRTRLKRLSTYNMVQRDAGPSNKEKYLTKGDIGQSQYIFVRPTTTYMVVESEELDQDGLSVK